MRPGLDPSGCSINLQDSKDLVRDESSLGLAPSQTSPTEGEPLELELEQNTAPAHRRTRAARPGYSAETRLYNRSSLCD